MKKLYLIRHAKAEKASAGIIDIDRPLHVSGIQEAGLMAARLFASGEIPDAITCSPSVRTFSTAMIFSRVLGLDYGSLKIEKNLYNASPSQLFEAICDTRQDINSLMIVGHNPSMSLLANTIDSSILHLSTASVACFELDIDKWTFADVAVSSRLFFWSP